MTNAVCMCCGLAKFGALVSCKYCHFCPQTGWETATSLIFSDKVINNSSLANLSSDLQSKFEREEPFQFNFDAGAKAYVRRIMDDPSGRDALVLRRSAKDGLLRKQIDLHIVGPNGHRSQAIGRGELILKTEFDSIRSKSKDGFIVEVLDAGESILMVVAKSVWYCMYDTSEPSP